MFILRDLLKALQTAFSDTSYGRERGWKRDLAKEHSGNIALASRGTPGAGECNNMVTLREWCYEKMGLLRVKPRAPLLVFCSAR